MAASRTSWMKLRTSSTLPRDSLSRPIVDGFSWSATSFAHGSTLSVQVWAMGGEQTFNPIRRANQDCQLWRYFSRIQILLLFCFVYNINCFVLTVSVILNYLNVYIRSLFMFTYIKNLIFAVDFVCLHLKCFEKFVDNVNNEWNSLLHCCKHVFDVIFLFLYCVFTRQLVYLLFV